jgi:hypothetical protein
MDGRRRDGEAAKRLSRNLFMARRRAGFSQEELGAMVCLHRTEDRRSSDHGSGSACLV